MVDSIALATRRVDFLFVVGDPAEATSTSRTLTFSGRFLVQKHQGTAFNVAEEEAAEEMEQESEGEDQGEGVED